jgi:hypothetical protein
MTDDLDRAAAKIVRAELKQFADEFVSGVLATVAGAKPPHAGGEQTPWTNAIAKVLEKMARRKNCDCYPWLLDYVWWSQKDGEEAMELAIESELDQDIREIGEDFDKLPSIKCDRKLLVFSFDPDETKARAEFYLQRFTQHESDNQYLLIGFTDKGPRCHIYLVPNDRKVQGRVQFEELPINTATS